MHVASKKRAWRVPPAGGTATPEAELPWAEIISAPAGGWRVVLAREPRWEFAAHLLPPGAPLDEPRS